MCADPDEHCSTGRPRSRRAHPRGIVLLVAATCWGCAGSARITDGAGRASVRNAWGPVRADAETPADRSVTALREPDPATPSEEVYSAETRSTGCAALLVHTEPLYALPYAPGDAYLVRQGTCGLATHHGRFAFAYDFDMPRGTPVLAARDGVVTAVVDDLPEDTNRSEHANYVVIRHGDGQSSRYLHLRTGGARVAVGDSVQTGDVIALSGNSGRSVTPHLHFDVVETCHGTDACPTMPATFYNADDPAPRSGHRYEAAGFRASNRP